MTQRAESILKEWGTWAFRGIIIGALALLYNEAKEIRRDVKTLMNERGSIQYRVGRIEKDVDVLQDAATNLHNRLIDHQLKHKGQ